VVNISSEVSASETAAKDIESALGSGLIIDPEGYVVTNTHVVERAKQIRVKLADTREFLADVVGRDASTDIALLKLQKAPADLPFGYFGDSDKLNVGDWVVAIGNPFGLEQSVSQGIISAKERVIGVGVFDDFLQTDALINPGNSGGPLFNMRGEVVGVNTAVVSQAQGIGFAVPINMVKDLLPNLKVNGHLARGWLGINVQEDLAEGEAPHKGDAVITDVYASSPAAQVGLKPGDRVLAVNGRPVESYLQLLRRVAILAPGSEAKLTIQRGKTTRDVTVKMGERPAPEAAPVAGAGGATERWGLVVQDLSDSVAHTLGMTPFCGVLVSGVVPSSPAQIAGIKAGDIINEVNRVKVQDVQSFKVAVESMEADQDLLVRFQRGDSNRYVAVRRSR
jgi:serine protease Do